MNVFGFVIKSSRFSNSSTYIVFANNEEEANKKIKLEVHSLIEDMENGWTWGMPTVEQLSEEDTKKLLVANIIW